MPEQQQITYERRLRTVREEVVYHAGAVGAPPGLATLAAGVAEQILKQGRSASQAVEGGQEALRAIMDARRRR